MRELSELLKIAKKEYNKVNIEYAGLCGLFMTMYFEDIITADEHKLLKDYIDNYLSKEHKFFYHMDKYNFNVKQYYKDRLYSKGAYGWKPGLKGARNKWLDRHIKLNENGSK